MAGPFGSNATNTLSQAARRAHVLYPAVRQASPDTLIVTDGFSCREQILRPRPRIST